MKRFKDLFCSHFRCAPEAYTREALKRTLYPHAAKLAWLPHWCCSPLWLRLIEQAGEVESGEELLDLIKFYQYDIQLHNGFWLRRWKFRVSGRRLVTLYAQVRRPQADHAGPDNSLPHALRSGTPPIDSQPLSS
jgi:hypothetical protein